MLDQLRYLIFVYKLQVCLSIMSPRFLDEKNTINVICETKGWHTKYLYAIASSVGHNTKIAINS